MNAEISTEPHTTMEKRRNLFDPPKPAMKLVQAVAQRLAVAEMLRRRVTYQEIAEKTGASTATISRVNRSLSYGAGGYHTVLSRMPADEAQD